MLKLKNVTKDYVSGELTVHALKGVSLNFRKSEFVAVLGPSGCGKTTLLNIMGGLDKYTTGDLEINGVSTVDYKDRDWDNYRNHSIGFVFQSYNLIMHQSVLANVELALTLSGVGKQERKQRAKDALIRVGLEKEINKMPNQLSGGQMQRVAIARAIVNNPDIILADEPTGALDTETSVQVMDILKEISADRLVVMVTHNPDLAKEYSNRIITMSDGLILEDTNPITSQEEEEIFLKKEAELEEKLKEIQEQIDRGEKPKVKKQKKAKMSIWTAFSLSLKNLFTKKARTILTSIAGSIGIIGIALILSVSSGFQSYIDNVESSTLSSQAVELRTSGMDFTKATTVFGGMAFGNKDMTSRPSANEIYTNDVTKDLVSDVSKLFTSTDLTGFKYYMENNIDNSKIHGVRYNYGVDPIRFYARNEIIRGYDKNYADGQNYKLLAPYDTARLKSDHVPLGVGSLDAVDTIVSMFNFNPFSTPLQKYDKASGKLVDNWDLVENQYDLLAGYNGYDLSQGLTENQMLLVVNEYNQIDDSVMFALGLKGEYDLLYTMIDSALLNGMFESRQGVPGVLDTLCNDLELGNITAESLGLGNQQAKFNEFKQKILDIKTQKDTNFGGYWVAYFSANEAQKKELLDLLIYCLYGYQEDTTRYLVDANGDFVLDKEGNKQEKPITFNEIFALNKDEALNRASGYKIIAQSDEYYDNAGVVDLYDYKGVNSNVLQNPAKQDKVIDVEVVGIVRLKEGATYGALNTGLVYSSKLLEKVNTITEENEFVTELRTYTDTAFSDKTSALYAKYKDLFANKDTGDLAKANIVKAMQMRSFKDVETPNGNISQVSVSSISMYASTFENKDYLVDFIDEYNEKVKDSENSGVYGDEVSYSDLMGMLFESIQIILDAITYVLIAFVGISLVVSSIMIGIITYISVLERTKEIGVLRSIGASKGDVGRVFNAETVIIGLVSGLFGVIVSALCTIPIRAVLKALTGTVIPIALPFTAAFILVLVSVCLTLISGLIPSRFASKKDPVVALRSE